MSIRKKNKATRSKPRTKIALKETAPPYRPPPRSAKIPAGQTAEDQGWTDFRDQCRRQMQRPMELRIKYGFSRPMRRAPDEWRAFETMADYRNWCEENLPRYLGFKRPAK